MNSKQIECFLTVAKYLNFTEAGEKLYTSQSNISRNISLLEEELDLKLFYRGNNYVRLTPAGAVMLSTFQQIEDFFSEQKKLAHYTNLGESGSLTIGFISFMAIEKFFAQILNHFQETYPNIIINYVIIEPEEFKNLSFHNIDIILTHEFDRPTSKSFLSKRLCYTDMFLIYGKKHRLYGKENLSVSDFQNELIWTTITANTNERDNVLDKVLSYYAIQSYKTATSSNIDTILLNISLGNGIMIIDSLTFPLISESFAILTIDPPACRIGIDLTWKKNNLNPAIPLFVNLLSPEEPN